MRGIGLVSRLIVVVWLLGVVGCGGSGGSGGSTAATQPARVNGNIVALNGSSSDVDGVEVEVMGTNSFDVSDDDGAFDLGDVPLGEHEILVTVPNPDGSVLVTFIVVLVFADGEVVSLRVSIDGEEFVRLSVERSCHDRDEVETRSILQPTLLGAGLSGYVEVKKDDDDAGDFDVEIEDLEAGEALTISLTDSTGTMEEIDIVADDFGKVDLELDSEDGDMLPFGVTDVADLEGVKVAILDGSGEVLLHSTVARLGSIPVCDDDDNEDGERQEGRTRLTNAAGVTGEADVKLRRDVGEDDERFEVEVESTNVNVDLELWLEDPDQPGVLVLIDAFVPDADELDEVEVQLRTEDGETLPFGVASVAELIELQLEIRRSDDGTVVFSGLTSVLRRV